MSAPVTSTLSPIVRWSEQQSAPANDGTKPKTTMQDVFLHMLQHPVDPLSGDATDSAKTMQMLADSYTRADEGKRLKGIETAVKESSRLQAASLVGKRGQFASRTFNTQKNDTPAYVVPDGTRLQATRIDLYNAETGRMVARLQGEIAPGHHDLSETFKDLPPGRYHFDATGLTLDNQETALPTLVTSEITTVAFDEDDTIQVGGADKQHQLDQLKGLYPHLPNTPFDEERAHAF